MKKFILIVLVLYLIYYAINIIYDGFLKKTKVEENSEGEEFIVDDDEQPKKITVDDVSFDEGPEPTGNYGAKEIQMSADEINIINGAVEDQGFTVDNFISEISRQLLGESKQMFAGVNF